MTQGQASTAGHPDMTGKRAIVTGAASGMGQATALGLIADGASVVAVDINDAGLEPVRAAGGTALVADISSHAGRALVIEAANAEPTDYLVNAAGILGLKPIWDVTEDDFHRVVAVNLESVWFLSRDVGKVLREGGAIVNFSSPSARWAYTVETAVYGATKTAIQAATRTFAVLHAPRHVRVNAISPGITRHADAGDRAPGGVEAARPDLRAAGQGPAQPRRRSSAPRRPRRSPGSSSGCCPTAPGTSPGNACTSTAATSCRHSRRHPSAGAPGPASDRPGAPGRSDGPRAG